MIKITECPRDAMQGIKQQIPTDLKVSYINDLLKVGFDTIDFGSFVSPKAIPQMQDTEQVLSQLNLKESKSKLLAIVANYRGAEQAASFSDITFLGFPFSVSETFQQRNTNSSISESLKRVDEIQNLCVKSNKHLVVYLSMAFGNPYGDAWSPDLVIKWCKKLHEMGIKYLPLADTIGCSTPENIKLLYSALLPEFPDAHIGAHLHSTSVTALEKIYAAYQSGCRRFDVALHGYGGCPMAKDDLTGNLSTQDLVFFMDENKIKSGLNLKALEDCYPSSFKIFNQYH